MNTSTFNAISEVYRFVAPKLAVFTEGPTYIKLLFIMNHVDEAEVVERMREARERIDRNRPAGIRVTIVHRTMSTVQIEACVALERLVGTDELLRQVFDLDPLGEWR